MDVKKLEKSCQRSTFVQVVLGLIANFGSLAPSMSLGFSAIALPTLLNPNNPFKLSQNEASWVASIASVATPIGCFISGPISDRLGRKLAILCINIVCFLGWIVIIIAYYLPNSQYSLLLTGRLLTGLSTGLCSMPAAVYMAEVSSSKLRGMFITWNALCFSLGVVIIYIFGWILQDNWGMIAIFAAAFPCVGFFMAWISMIESPPWLLSKNRVEEAKAAMCKLFNTNEYTLEVYEEIETLISHRNNAINYSQSGNRFNYLLQPVCYKPFVLMSTYFFFQQFSGTFVIIFYAVDIVKEAKITIDPYLAICLIASMRVLGSLFVSIMSKRVGRRPLSLTSGAGMTLCLALLSVYLVCVNEEIISSASVKSLDWIPLTLMILYFFTATLGFLTMPFAMSAEVFPSKIRGLATGMVTCFGYICNFVIVKLYPDMLHSLGIYKLFIFYGTFSLAGTIFVVLALPETKGKTLPEIEEYFSGKKLSQKEILEMESISLTIT